MKVDWKDPADAPRLRELINGESDAKQRDRYRVVLIAGEGLGEQRELEREAIAQTVNRARQFVDQWVGRYRSNGIDALRPKRQPGAKSKLTAEQQQELCVMLDTGPDPAEGLAAFNVPILRERIQQRFGKLYSLAGVYALLHRLGYNDLMPRTTHPDTDPAELEAFKKVARASGSTQSRPSRQTPADLLPGRSAIRPARHDHPRVGQSRQQTAGNPANAV
jgi:transposase